MTAIGARKWSRQYLRALSLRMGPQRLNPGRDTPTVDRRLSQYRESRDMGGWNPWL